MVDDEGESSISRSFSARLRRKEQVARGEDVPETLEEEQAAASAPAPDPTAESEEDAALDDNQLLQKYGLSNPEDIEHEAGLEAFMEKGLPDRLRQMALRRMWRLNPLFRFADEMVEYGENYTDAATVIDGKESLLDAILWPSAKGDAPTLHDFLPFYNNVNIANASRDIFAARYGRYKVRWVALRRDAKPRSEIFVLHPKACVAL